HEIDPEVVEKRPVRLKETQAKTLEGQRYDIGREREPDRREGAPEAPLAHIEGLQAFGPAVEQVERSLERAVDLIGRNDHEQPLLEDDCPRKWSDPAKRSG